MATTKLPDRVRSGIDKKILIPVAALRASGFETTASCQGHLSWGLPAPWIDIGLTELESMKRRRLRQPEVAHHYEQLREINLRSQQHLVRLVNSFYKRRPITADTRLIVIPIGIWGRFRLINQGAAFQDILSPRQKSEKLRRFQLEFSRFADFIEKITLKIK